MSQLNGNYAAQNQIGRLDQTMKYGAATPMPTRQPIMFKPGPQAAPAPAAAAPQMPTMPAYNPQLQRNQMTNYDQDAQQYGQQHFWDWYDSQKQAAGNDLAKLGQQFGVQRGNIGLNGDAKPMDDAQYEQAIKQGAQRYHQQRVLPSDQGYQQIVGQKNTARDALANGMPTMPYQAQRQQVTSAADTNTRANNESAATIGIENSDAGVRKQAGDLQDTAVRTMLPVQVGQGNAQAGLATAQTGLTQAQTMQTALQATQGNGTVSRAEHEKALAAAEERGRKTAEDSFQNYIKGYSTGSTGARRDAAGGTEAPPAPQLPTLPSTAQLPKAPAPGSKADPATIQKHLQAAGGDQNKARQSLLAAGWAP